jgi:hypothetical protein
MQNGMGAGRLLPRLFVPVYHKDADGDIAGHDLRSHWDRMMTFDYDSSGKQDIVRRRQAPQGRAERAPCGAVCARTGQ